MRETKAIVCRAIELTLSDSILIRNSSTLGSLPKRIQISMQGGWIRLFQPYVRIRWWQMEVDGVCEAPILRCEF